MEIEKIKEENTNCTLYINNLNEKIKKQGNGSP